MCWKYLKACNLPYANIMHIMAHILITNMTQSLKTFYETIKQDLEEIGDKMKNAEVSKHYLLCKCMLQTCIENKNKYNLYSITH